jgi:hypothetical protein
VGACHLPAPLLQRYMTLVQTTRECLGTYPLPVSDLSDELHSVLIDWPDGVPIDEPKVRYVSQEGGVSFTWEEIERIPHPAGIEVLFARIEVVFRRTS